MKEAPFILKVPQWTGTAPSLTIRAEYALMVSELRHYAKDFRLEVSESQYNDLAILALTTEKLDFAFDSCSAREGRRRLSEQVCRMLSGQSQDLDAPSELRWVLNRFCDMARRRGLENEFAELAQAIFACGEAKRECLEPRAFVRILDQESDHLVSFLLLILGPQPKAFRDFAIGLQRSTNLLDDIMDMSEDHRDGSQSLRPNWELYVRVLLASLKNAISALLVYPQKRRLLWLILSFVPWVGRSFGVAREKGLLDVRVCSSESHSSSGRGEVEGRRSVQNAT